MKFFVICMITFLSMTQSLTRADSVDSVNGNLIREPSLSDYQKAERTPGFSPITEIQE